MKVKQVVSKKKSSVLPSKTKIKNKIRGLWNQIPWPFFHENKDWYWECNKWCRALADEKKVDMMLVCGIFSALSPQNSYKMNKIFCRAYFEGICKHTKVQTGKCHLILTMYGIDSIQLRKQQIVQVLGGKKTQEFFLAILEPWNTGSVVIDRHMLDIAGVDKPTVTSRQYEYLKKCYLEVAEECNITGTELQSVLWCWWRQEKFGHNLYG